MTKILCKLGLHKKVVIGATNYPYDTTLRIIAFGCSRCGKKFKKGELRPLPDSY